MYFLQLLTSSPIAAAVFLLSMVSAVTVHEFAHAWTATLLGDDTPRLQGRVTLNPAAHLDPLGSVAFLLLGFGWGKPVVYNPIRLKRRSDELLIALAGPASNLVTAFLLNCLTALLARAGSGTEVLQSFFGFASYINLILAAFNLIPIPPLDGSSIVAYFWPEYRSLVGSQIGLILLLIVILVPLSGGQSVVSSVVTPLVQFFNGLTHLFGLLPDALGGTLLP